jgi:hypothetical protein
MKPFFVGYETWPDRRGGWRRGDRQEIDGDDLVRHAFVCGATGAGKTVFAKSIVEEAVLAGVPAILIDLKGDLVSMALHQGLTAHPDFSSVFGAKAPALKLEYEEGLSSQRAVRTPAARYAEEIELRIFSPRAPIGRRLAMSALPSFDASSQDDMERAERRHLIRALVRGLGERMYGARTVAKRNLELTLLEELVEWCGEQGMALDGIAGLQQLGRLVDQPPLTHIGGMDIDEYISPRNRKDIQRRIAAQCAGANQDWFDGEPLNVETLIGNPSPGRTPLALLYLGHLSEFRDQSLVIAQVCASLYRWMRSQGGASSLRLMLYIDEVGGSSGPTSFFPSSPYQPPSKAPLGLLVRQGRAHGLGVLLATQNPMSVDVQALNNIGTWAVGSLNQDNEIRRISGALEADTYSSRHLRQELASAQTRCFLTRTPDGNPPRWIHERWLSSIHTVLTKEQVKGVHRILEEMKVSLPPLPRPAGPLDPAEVPGLPPVREPVALDTLVDEPWSGETEATRVLPDQAAQWELSIGEMAPISLEGLSITIGRSGSCEVTCKGDEYMSSRHLELRLSPTHVEFVPLKMTNPPVVGEKRLRAPHVVPSTSLPISFQLGRTAFVLDLREDT